MVIFNIVVVTKKYQSCIVLVILWVVLLTLDFLIGGQMCLREFSKYLKLGNFFLRLDAVK